jgi:hypothetical protein
MPVDLQPCFDQGDQLSFGKKNRQNVSKLTFLSKLMHDLFHGKSLPKIWAASVHKFLKLLKIK